MSLDTVNVTRYVAPLREGGSLPGLVEADDDGMYVLKFRGAGQGPKALIAELVAGEIARALGLPVPTIVLVGLDVDLARTEADPEIQDLMRASAGLNVALDYLPGALMFDPVVERVEGELASKIVWFDGYVTNVDRTARNPNLLVWHRKLQLIDHGAALYFHHSWAKHLERSRDPFVQVKDHVLLRFADRMAEIDALMVDQMRPEVLRDVLGSIPDSWLASDTPFASPDAARAAYLEYLTKRLESPRPFLDEAIRARSHSL
jgi:HipA-like kinase